MKNLFRTIFCLLALALSSPGQQLIFPQGPPNASILARYFGSAGATSYYYWVVARYPYGYSYTNGPATVTSAAASLSSSDAVNVSWSSVTGATGYDLLRTASATPPSGACNCAVTTNTTSTAYNDVGAALQTYTVATAGLLFPDATAQDTAASGTPSGPTVVSLSQINDTANTLPVLKFSGVASSVNQLTAVNSATGDPAQVQATGSDTNIDIKLVPKGSGIVNIPKVIYAADLSITTANLNAGTSNTIVAAVTGRTYTVYGFFLMALGGNTSGCTDVRISDTAGSPVDVATEVIAGLVQNQGITEGSSVTNLTFGAGWMAPLTTSQGIQIRKTGGACATSTSFYARVFYSIS